MRQLLIFSLFSPFFLISVYADSPTACNSEIRINRIIKNFKDAQNGQILVVAHRGFYKHCPENSISSVLAAADLGVDIVEIDVAITKDNHLVVMHDPTVDRTTTGKGKVSDLTLAEIKQLYLKDKDGGISSERVPTVEELLTAIRGKCMVNLDRSEYCLQQCIDLVEKLNMAEQIILKGSGDAKTVKAVLNDTQTAAHYGPIIYCNNASSNQNSFEKYKNSIELMHPEMVEIVFFEENCSLISKEAIEISNKYDVRLWCNSLFSNHAAGHVDSKAVINPEANWGWIIKQGVDIIQTDEANVLLQYLRSKQLHE